MPRKRPKLIYDSFFLPYPDIIMQQRNLYFLFVADGEESSWSELSERLVHVYMLMLMVFVHASRQTEGFHFNCLTTVPLSDCEADDDGFADIGPRQLLGASDRCYWWISTKEISFLLFAQSEKSLRAHEKLNKNFLKRHRESELNRRIINDWMEPATTIFIYFLLRALFCLSALGRIESSASYCRRWSYSLASPI